MAGAFFAFGNLWMALAAVVSAIQGVIWFWTAAWPGWSLSTLIPPPAILMQTSAAHYTDWFWTLQMQWTFGLVGAICWGIALFDYMGE